MIRPPRSVLTGNVGIGMTENSPDIVKPNFELNDMDVRLRRPCPLTPVKCPLSPLFVLLVFYLDIQVCTDPLGSILRQICHRDNAHDMPAGRIGLGLFDVCLPRDEAG